MPTCGTTGLEARQVHPRIKLPLVLVRRHVRALLVERLVVIAILQVRQSVHDDHLQERGRGVVEHGREADFSTGLELVALDTGKGLEARHSGRAAPSLLLGSKTFALAVSQCPLHSDQPGRD